MNSVKFVYLATGLVLHGLAFGQFSFTTSISTTNGDVEASGSLDFDLESGTVDFTVENSTAFMSEITGVWFLNPVVDGTGSSANFTGVEHNNSGNFLPDDASDWNQSSGVDTGTWQFVRQQTGASQKDKGKYVGAQVLPSSSETLESPVTPSEISTFSFDVPELSGKSELFLGDYFSQQSVQHPAVVFRWKTVDPQFVDGGSAKGFAYIDLQINPIPEPRHIAVFSLTGLAGLLYARRRFRCRRNSRTASRS